MMCRKGRSTRASCLFVCHSGKICFTSFPCLSHDGTCKDLQPLAFLLRIVIAYEVLIRSVWFTSPETRIWSTQIHVLPGTHHFKFIVDEQWRITDQYPTAVDDLDGSLANYVNATSPTSGSPSSSSPQPTPQPNQINQFASFWSDNSSRDGSGVGEGAGKGEAAWTTLIPQELINAASEEEQYLANAGGSPSTSSSIPAPNIPPAPVLPRHLDKLILNVRPQIAGAPGSPGDNSRSRKEKEREREKDRSRRDRKDRERDGKTRPHPPSHLGMTSAVHDGGSDHDTAHLALPVVTPSGTDVSAMYGSSGPPTPGEEGSQLHHSASMSASKKLSSATAKWTDTLALADDATVLPVPSHVVIHHLSTSAIKNGVLAVANTTRYKKKVSSLLVSSSSIGVTDTRI